MRYGPEGRAVTVLNDAAEFNDTQLAVFDKMLRYGPQFMYRKDEKEIKVELTANGLNRFKRMYVHRPIPSRVDGNFYYFDCSYSQVSLYFSRFGKDAVILYPKELSDKLTYFHRDAFRRYLKYSHNDTVYKPKK